MSGAQGDLPFPGRLSESGPGGTEAAGPPPARRNLVIDAGAGTGKTTAIVAEVLELLLGDETLAPERIILVTFTEKAAGEIADRIHAALADLATRFDQPEIVWPAGSPSPPFRVPPERREAYRRACEFQLARVDSLRSQTIHSFCQALLRQHPIEAGLDPQFKIIEGFERSLLYDRLYDAWFDAETRTSVVPEQLADWELLLSYLGYLGAISEAVFALVERRDLLGQELSLLGTMEELEPTLLDVIDSVRRCQVGSSTPPPRSIRRPIGSSPLDDDLAPDVGRVIAYLRRVDPPRGGSLNSWIDYFASIAGDIESARLPPKRDHPELNAAIDALRIGDKGDSIHDRLCSHRAAVGLYRMASRFVSFLDAEKRTLGVVDFDDLLLRTRALLEEPGVLEQVRAQHDFIFVDEFQDTDRVQAQIIDRLSRGRDGRPVGGKTTIVGDPKQSIYGFRRADPETYARTRKRLREEGGDLRELDEQYRSDPPLLDAINAIFGKLFPEVPNDPNVFRPAYHPLRAGRQNGQIASAPEEPRLIFLHSDHHDKADQYRAEAQSIAAWIDARRDHDPARDLRRFAILMRRLTEVDDYLDALERFGIDYVLPPTRYFLDRRTAVDLLSVLRAIAYPFDRGAEISAARTPYFALIDDEIAAGVLEATDAKPEPYRSFLAALDQYRHAARHTTVSGLIDRVIADCRIEEYFAATTDRERSLRHLEHIGRLAFDYDRRTGGSVAQFVDEIASRRDNPDEVEPTLADDTQNAVRVMTIHGAKGLEFETVIIPDLAFDRTGDNMDILSVEEPPALVMRGRAKSLSGYVRFANGEPLKAIQKQREDAEMHRLFYVAVTRAQRDVVFASNVSGFQKRGFWKCIGDIFGIEKAALGALWPDRPGRRIDAIDVEGTLVAAAFERMPDRDENARRKRLAGGTGLDEEAIRSSAIAPIAIPLPPSIERLAPGIAAARRAGARNKATGILLHRVLELWDGDPAALDRLFESAAREQGADDGDRRRVRQRLSTLGQSASMARFNAAETIGRELPIWYQDGGVRVEARIDRLLRENGSYLVVDYKSGRPTDERLPLDSEQVRRYCRAIARITGEACRGALWYVDVDEDRLIDVDQ